MGGRAVLAAIAGALIVIVAVVLGSRYLPEPADRIEWLHREDSIIVQMQVSGGMPRADLQDRIDLPDFTLYGDGTLLFVPPDQRDELASPEARLFRATVPDKELRDLLELVDGTGFFNFAYQQPRPPASLAPADSPTTFLYVATRDEANAVSAYGLGAGEPPGDEFAQYRAIDRIRARLDGLASAPASPYRPEAGILFAVPRVATDFIGVPQWPYPSIALPNAPLDAVGRVNLSAGQLDALALAHPESSMCWLQVQYASRLYDVCYRPALPFEEHFPEFDAQ